MADEKIAESFCQEAQEHLGQISDALILLEKEGAEEQPLQDIWRVTHSLKGGASVAGLMDVAQTAHAMEDVLAALQEGRLQPTPEVVDALFSATDSLQAYLSAAGKQDAAQIDMQPTVAQLQALASREEDVLSTRLPDLSAELMEVLTERQKRHLIETMEGGQAVFEVSAHFKGDTFTQDIEELGRKLAKMGEVICKSGTAEDVKEGYDLRFKVLLVSSGTQKAVKGALSGAEAEVRLLGQQGKQVVSREETQPPVPEEPQPVSDDIFQDPAMIELQKIFLEEAAERLDDLSNHILALEKSPEDMEVVNELFRVYHSLKGTGGTYGFPIISTVAHELETLMDTGRKAERPLGPEAIDLLLESVDVLGKIFQQAKEGALDQSQEIPLVERVRAYLRAGVAPKPEKELAPKVKPVAPPPAAPAIRALGEETIRVGLDKLDHLVQITSEMVLGKSRVEDIAAVMDRFQRATRAFQREFRRLKDRLRTDVNLRPILDDLALRRLIDERTEDTEKLMSRLEDVAAQVYQWSTKSDLLVDELQEEVLNIRMLPVANLFHPLTRTVRDLSKGNGKEISLVISGEDTELDKRVMEEISDPLMHIIRNCVDHGIEPPEVREKADKPRAGTIWLSARQEGNRVVIEVEDDGAGIDPDKVKRAAVEKGLMEEGQAASLKDEEAIRLIFEPGFTTKDAVSTVSGRGVGMDVVKTNIAKLTGTVDVESKVGKGTKSVIKLPLTLAVVQGLIVRCGAQIFCIQTTSVDDVSRLSEDSAEMTTIGGQHSIPHEGHMLPLVRLADLLGLGDAAHDEQPRFVVVVHSAENKRIGLIVDELVREESIVVKNLGDLLGPVENVAGATVLSDGDIALVLGASALIQTAETKQAVGPVSAPELTASEARRQTVMVVDDSLIARELLTSIVESCGHKAISAPNGVEALRELKNQPCDLVITDINMPVVDGLELTSQIKKERKLNHIPVIVVSATEDDEAKKKATEAGADAFIEKGAFEQRDLVTTMEGLLSLRAAAD